MLRPTLLPTLRFLCPAGSWENGGPTGIPMIYANLMKDGTVIGWATTYAGPIGGSGRNDQYGTVVSALPPPSDAGETHTDALACRSTEPHAIAPSGALHRLEHQ